MFEIDLEYLIKYLIKYLQDYNFIVLFAEKIETFLEKQVSNLL